MERSCGGDCRARDLLTFHSTWPWNKGKVHETRDSLFSMKCRQGRAYT